MFEGLLASLAEIAAKVGSSKEGGVQVYGTTIRALIEEEFGDGIMSAIDFSMDIGRQPNPKG